LAQGLSEVGPLKVGEGLMDRATRQKGSNQAMRFENSQIGTDTKEEARSKAQQVKQCGGARQKSQSRRPQKRPVLHVRISGTAKERESELDCEEDQRALRERRERCSRRVMGSEFGFEVESAKIDDNQGEGQQLKGG